MGLEDIYRGAVQVGHHSVLDEPAKSSFVIKYGQTKRERTKYHPHFFRQSY